MRALRRHATSAALIVVAVAVALYAWLVDFGKVGDVERAMREGSVFPAFRRQDISRVELVQGADSLVLERGVGADADDMDWRVTSPRREPAEIGQVHQLLTELELATRVRTVDPSPELALDAPRLKGTLVMGDVTFRFALGASSPVPAGSAYLRVDGEGIFVVKKELVEQLLKGADAYRARSFLPYLSMGLAALEVTGEHAGLSVERVDNVEFKIARSGLRASRAAINRVWRAFADMRADTFLADDVADRSIAAPVLTMTMTPKEEGKPKGVVVVGGPCPTEPDDVVVVRRAPLPRVNACVPKQILGGLATTDEVLVDDAIVGVAGDDIAELTLETIAGGGKLDIARAGVGWHERAPVDRALTSGEIDSANALANALASARGEAPRKLGTGEAFAARVRATVARGGGRGVEIIEIGEGAAHRLADDAVLRVDPLVARLFAPRAVALRSPSLLRATDGASVSALATTCSSVAEELVHEDRGWTMRRPLGYAADAEGVFEVANTVLHAHAELWISDDDDPVFGFGASPCSVAVTLGRDARIFAIELGHDAPAHFAGLDGDSVFARIKGSREVFLVTAAVRDAAKRLLVDRAGFRVDAAAASRVTLATDKKKVTVSADAGTSEVAEKVAVALAALAAADVIHLGKASPDEQLGQPVLEVRAEYRDDAGKRETHFIVGAKDAQKKRYFARLDGVDATFAIDEAKIDAVVEAF